MSGRVKGKPSRILAVYGSFGLLLAAQIFVVDLLGMDVSGIGAVIFGSLSAILLVLAFVVEPVGLLMLLIAWIPFQRLVEFELGIVTLNLYTAGMIGLLSVGLLIFEYRSQILRFSSTDWWIIALCASYSISTFTSDSLIVGGYLAFHALFIPVITYMVVKSYLAHEGLPARAAAFLIAGIILFAIYALSQFTMSQRIVVANVAPISAAALFVCGIVLLLGGSARKKWYFVVFALVLLGGLFSTFSRGYLVLILLTPFIFRYIRRGKSYKLMVFMLVGSFLLTIMLAYQPGLVGSAQIDRSEERTLARLTELDYWKYSLYGRGYTYRAGLESFPEHPFFGTGMYRSEDQNIRHNFHVEWLEYGGAVGFILYWGMFISHFKRMRLLATKEPLVAASMTMILTILLNGLTNSFTIGVSTYIAFLLMGLNEAALVTSKRPLSNPIASNEASSRRLLHRSRGSGEH